MSVTIGTAPTKTQSVGEFIRDKARSILIALGEAAKKFDELPLENKQEIKEGFVKLLAMSGQHPATIKLLTREDEELSRILADHGWWVLPKDINGPVKRDLLGFGREGNADEVDRYLCSLFNQNDGARLKERIETWFTLPFFADRKQIVLDGLEAHRVGKWTLSIPSILPLIDGLMRRFRKEHLRASKNPRRVMHDARFVEYYRRKRPKLFGKSLASFMHNHVFAFYDLNTGTPPSSINRHGILHGEIPNYATEANSLKVFLLLDTISQLVSFGTQEVPDLEAPSTRIARLFSRRF
jgi:hypothetical protein